MGDLICSLYDLAQELTCNYYTKVMRFGRDKHSSLFSDEENKVLKD